MKTLVTGGSGFVGAAVVRTLLAAGHAVRVLMRPTSPTNNLDGLDVETAVGDLRDDDSLLKAVKDCHALFHVAADYRLWSADPGDFYQVNVDGTRRLMLAAADAGVQRIVYTSSVATLGLYADGRPADEQTPVTLADMVGHYKRSKYLGEEAVRELIRNRGLPAIIVNPSTPIGPRDIKPTPTGRIIVDTINGQMPAYVDTGLNLVHVDDVARGHLLAFSQGKVGERYILGGQNMSLQAILACVAEQAGIKAPRIRLPHGLVLPLAYLNEFYIKLRGSGEPRVSIDAVRMSRKRMYFASVKAEQELGYRSQPAYQAIADAIAWFREHGYCRS